MSFLQTTLITGSSGSLGSVASAYFRSLGHDVVRACRTKDDKTVGSNIPLDVTDFERVMQVVKSVKPALIIHLAATFTTEFDAALETNVIGARNFLEAVRAAGNGIRVVLVGSAAEYGVVIPEENPVKESHRLRPISVYGLTKAWQTQLGLMYALQGNDVVIARIFNLDGEEMSERLFVGRVDKQIREIESGNASRIEVGPLSAIRDYISLEDATCQLAAISKYGVSGEIYHVASGKPVTMRDLLNQKLKKSNLTFDIVDEGTSLGSHSGYDVPVAYADVSRIKKLWEEMENEHNQAYGCCTCF